MSHLSFLQQFLECYSGHQKIRIKNKRLIFFSAVNKLDMHNNFPLSKLGQIVIIGINGNYIRFFQYQKFHKFFVFSVYDLKVVSPFCKPKVQTCVTTMVYRRKYGLRTSLKVQELETNFLRNCIDRYVLNQILTQRLVFSLAPADPCTAWVYLMNVM